MNKLQLSLGRWLMRNGGIATISHRDSGSQWPWGGAAIIAGKPMWLTWRNDGSYSYCHKQNPLDIVGPVPVAQPASVQQSDAINPQHYKAGGAECIEVLESLGLGRDYCHGNAIKYLWRLGKKGDPLEDARKAQWYINRLVAALETGQSP